jgi:hypothetical protein
VAGHRDHAVGVAGRFKRSEPDSGDAHIIGLRLGEPAVLQHATLGLLYRFLEPGQ